MRREAVESSSLKSVGYSPESRTLEVEFQHGAVYRYLGVPPTVHDALAERANVLQAAYRAHPERFVHGVSSPPKLPTAAWINKPSQPEASTNLVV